MIPPLFYLLGGFQNNRYLVELLAPKANDQLYRNPPLLLLAPHLLGGYPP